MKAIAVLLTFILLFITSQFVAVPSRAVQSYVTGTTLFSDNFDDGNYNGWTVENTTLGGWSASTTSKNVLANKTTRNVGNYLKYNSGNWDNFSLEVDVYNNGGIDTGVAFRRADANNSYEVDLRFGSSSTYLTPEIKLIKYQAGVLTTLRSTYDFPLLRNHTPWYKLKIEAYGEHIQVWLDSVLVFEVDDSGTTVTSGTIAFSYWTGDYGSIIARFDNVAVQSLALPTPTPSPTSTPTPEPTSTPTPTPTPDPTPTLDPTPTSTPSATPTEQPTPTPTPAPEPTPTPTPAPTSTPTPTIIRYRPRPTALPTLWPTLTPIPTQIIVSPTSAVLGAAIEQNIQKDEGFQFPVIFVILAFILLLLITFIIANSHKSKPSEDN